MPTNQSESRYEQSEKCHPVLNGIISFFPGSDGYAEITSNTRNLGYGQGGGGRGEDFHYKGIYRCAAGMGSTFQASKYMNRYHFHLKTQESAV